MNMATPRPEPLIHNQAPAPLTHERRLTNEERLKRWNERVKQYMVLLVDNKSEENKMNDTEKYWLQCIANADGNITKEQFFDDCEPLGPMIWPVLEPHVHIDSDGKLTVKEQSND